VAAVKAYYERTDGVRMLEGDGAAVFRFDPAGRFVFEDSLAKRMIGRWLGHLPSPAYQRLTCPSLAIYAVPDSQAPRFPGTRCWIRPAAHKPTASFRLAGLEQCVEDAVPANAPLAHIVEIHNAHHYVFESNRAETLHAIRALSLGCPVLDVEHSSAAR